MKETKFAIRLMSAINITFSMLYVAAIDSLSLFNIMLYGTALAGLWYVVKLLNDKLNKESEN